MFPYMLTKNSLTIVVNDKIFTFDKTHPNFSKVLDAIKDKNESLIVSLVDIEQNIKDYSKGKLSIKNGKVYYDSFELKNSITDKLLQMMKEGFDIDPLVNFINNLLLNPSKRAIDEFYGWMEKANLPITEDGYFLAYKKVRNDYKDIHSGTYDNSPGKTISEPRNMVDDNPNNTCSKGLHFCSKEYLPNFGSHSGNDRIMILKINPKDVVSIPVDYNLSKGRCCEYTVLGELTDNKINLDVAVTSQKGDILSKFGVPVKTPVKKAVPAPKVAPKRDAKGRFVKKAVAKKLDKKTKAKKASK